jgi:hypothetical protein
MATSHRGVVALVMLFTLAGCGMQVKSEKGGEKGEKVAISTPLGDLKANTKDVDPADTGLSVYPGARQKEKTDTNEGRANVNLNTPWFGLKVVALSYVTDDSPEKVWEYYKAEMNRKYGRTLECRPGSPDMKIEKTSDDDLTCDAKDGKQTRHKGAVITTSDMELKSGSDGRQRIVAVKPTATGTEFALVYVVTRKGAESM